MKTEEMIHELRRLEEVHRDDFVGTGETNWSCMCRDVANRLEELLKAQEPRLVTEADFENADECGYLPAWCETKDDLFCECILIGALEEEGCRYWTVKPTDEQRKVTPWN